MDGAVLAGDLSVLRFTLLLRGGVGWVGEVLWDVFLVTPVGAVAGA